MLRTHHIDTRPAPRRAGCARGRGASFQSATRSSRRGCGRRALEFHLAMASSGQLAALSSPDLPAAAHADLTASIPEVAEILAPDDVLPRPPAPGPHDVAAP